MCRAPSTEIRLLLKTDKRHASHAELQVFHIYIAQAKDMQPPASRSTKNMLYPEGI